MNAEKGANASGTNLVFTPGQRRRARGRSPAAILRELPELAGADELGGAVALLVGTALVAPRLGTEFLPKLEEGNLWIRATLPATISLEAGEPYVARVRDILRSFPEVITVISQHGRPDDGTDPTGFYNVEFFAPLKPFDRWPRGEPQRSARTSGERRDLCAHRHR